MRKMRADWMPASCALRSWVRQAGRKQGLASVATKEERPFATRKAAGTPGKQAPRWRQCCDGHCSRSSVSCCSGGTPCGHHGCDSLRPPRQLKWAMLLILEARRGYTDRVSLYEDGGGGEGGGDSRAHSARRHENRMPSMSAR